MRRGTAVPLTILLASLVSEPRIAPAQEIGMPSPSPLQAPSAFPPAPGRPAALTVAPPTALPQVTAPPVVAEQHRSELYLSAVLTTRDAQPIRSGPIHWRVFADQADAQGHDWHAADALSRGPPLTQPDGTYSVHAALDLASAVRRVTIAGRASSERLVLNAGALRIVGMLGDKPINPAKLSITIFVPEAGNSEAKLVLNGAKAGDLIALPEGNYHVVSTLLDTAGYSGGQRSGVGNKTNSVVAADLRVQGGKLTDAVLHHRSAVMTLKLVNEPGGEALANTAFTILTPGGDIIRELIGAFPSLVLAEGEYVAVARHDARTYQTTFKVSATLDRDIEVVAK